ncbi:MAG: glycerol-3-phosphate dehydrogenase [Candidatus Bipolaricaulia bacterium]
MRRDLKAMADEQFDVLVIGGGINGTGIARDAALRGLKVALVEQEDFGYGTTSRATRIIHGGLRYLELYEFGLVRESLKEREILLRIAPHLVRPLLFLVPVYRGDPHALLTVRIGMILYDLLSWGKSLKRHRKLSRGQVLELEPELKQEGLKGGMLYYDAQVEYSERLCVENALCAADHGALIANHAEVVDFLKVDADEKIVGARVRDRFTDELYELRARVIVNAAGPWADRLHQIADPDSLPRLRPTKGIHILVPQFTRHAIVMLAQQDDRLFFAIPWRGLSLVGTTDTDFDGDPGTVTATQEDVDYLANETRRLFPKVDLNIYYTMAGVRPLVHQEGVSASQVSRKHKIIDHRADGLDGLISILGGKITNYRKVAEDAVDLIGRKLNHDRPCLTDRRRLYGGEIDDLEAAIETAVSEYSGLGLEREQIASLVRTYGSQYEAILKRVEATPELGEGITETGPEIWAQLDYGVEHEMVCSAADFLLRRTGIGLRPEGGLDCVAEVSARIGARLGWDESEVERDVEAYRDEVKR